MIANPAFSIILPTFQRREAVRDAIKALCHVDYGGRIEIIVAVDGSTDGTAQALRSLDCPFPLRILEFPNGGAARARNEGAATAIGDILLFLDDDMICERDIVEQHARMFREGADAVTGEVYLDQSSPRTFITDSVRRWISLPRPDTADLPFNIYTGQLSVRRSVFLDIGGFDEGFTSDSSFGHEDTDFGVKLLARYRVRHNHLAISRQRYLVGPRETMARAPRAAAADVRFTTKYPRFAAHLFEQKGRSQRKTRWIYWPLSRIPLLPRILAATAVWLAERAVKGRFRCNRFVSYFFFAARAVLYWSALWQRGGMPASHSVLILCYHAIQDQSNDRLLAPYGVPEEQFVAQLNALKRRRFVFIGPDAFEAFIRDHAPLPRRAVLLTFDDCYSELLSVVRDLLHPDSIEALAFAVTAIRSGTNEWDQPHGAGTFALLGRDELRELRLLGIEIGAHSRTHRQLPLLSDEEQWDETAGARDDLARLGLERPRYFAYPYGAHDSHSIRAVRDAGYLAAFGVNSRYADRASDPFLLPRVPILSSDKRIRFRLKTSYPRLLEWADVNSHRVTKVWGHVTAAFLA